jgi:uncharacterized protein
MQHPFDTLLIKLAARCNINCTYCYWFRDESVYSKPKRLTQEAENELLIKLDKYLSDYNFEDFAIIFHGGEPLLFGKERFASLCQNLTEIQKKIKPKISLGITTNGILIDEEWARLFAHYKLKVTVSLDGPASIHDASRKDFKNNGTHGKVIKGIQLLRKFDIDPGILTVCSPSTDPALLLDEFVNKLNITHFDVLIPDYNHEDQPPSIAAYYIKLYDLWYEKYSDKVSILTIDGITKGLLGKRNLNGCVGYHHLTLVTMLTDGSLEVEDTLRIAGNSSTASSTTIFNSELHEIQKDPIWQFVYESSKNLSETCQNCEYSLACGAGPLQTRWSKSNNYNNPSVYCSDLKQIFSHAAEKIVADLY